MSEQSKKNKELLETALKRFTTISKAEHDIREASLEDIRFAYNVEEGQWPEDLRNEREDKKRPCLTANKLRKFIAQVSNRERDARIVSKVVPVDDAGDVKTAKIYDDIIRHIEFNSKATEIYSKGGEQAIAGGFGYWRINTKFMEDGFDQEIEIKAIENQFSVYFDPRGNYCFIREGMTREDFKEAYPNAEITDFEGGSSGEKYSLWYEEEKVFIAEYFYKKPVTKELVQVIDPLNPEGEMQIIELTEDVTKEKLKAMGFQELRSRKVKSHKVMWIKMSGLEVLEEGEYASQYIPVVQVVGDEVNIEGKTYKRSLIRDGKDSQRSYNYWITTMTETVALAPNAPYILTAEQIEGHEGMWNTANVDKKPYLLYNETGDRVPVPARQSPPQVPSGAAFMLNIADNDIQDTIGMFDASFGQTGNERSKVAIDARSQRSDLGTFHFSDNLNRAILHTTRILIDMIPKIYDTERIIRIRGEKEGEEAPLKINEIVDIDEEGNITLANDLSVGRYDVREDLRSSATRRQESVQFMLQAIQYAPDAALIILEPMFRMQDWDGAQAIADKIKELLGSRQAEEGQPETLPAQEAGQ